MPQVSHVTLGRRCFFPAPTRQIVINDITALAVLLREQILESAAPEVHEGGATDQRLELVGSRGHTPRTAGGIDDAQACQTGQVSESYCPICCHLGNVGQNWFTLTGHRKGGAHEWPNSP